MLVISGPNTGGKTVALKTVGLAVLSAQSGIPVAAEIARLPMVDRVLVDIGDEQSIAADLSTFSAHMLNVRAMLEAATPHSLVLVDELGTGTAPEEGAALAVALLDEFRERGCLTLATTHHDRLKTYASTTPGVLNAAVEFDEINLRPTYRLMVGVPGGSSGIDIARRLGLPAHVIDRARAQLSPEAHEAAGLIAYLHRSRDELETLKREATRAAQELAEEKKQLQTEWTDRQRTRLKELEQQFAQTIEKHEKEVARAIEAVKERELRAQLEKQTHTQTRESARRCARRSRRRDRRASVRFAGRPGHRRGAIREARRAERSCSRRSRARARPAHSGNAAPPRRNERRSRSRAAANEGRARRHHGHRRRGSVRRSASCRGASPCARSLPRNPPARKSTSSAAPSRKPRAAWTNFSIRPRSPAPRKSA